MCLTKDLCFVDSKECSTHVSVGKVPSLDTGNAAFRAIASVSLIYGHYNSSRFADRRRATIVRRISLENLFTGRSGNFGHSLSDIC